MIHIDIKDKDLFGNDAGEDENIDVLNSYYIDNSDFEDFFDRSVRLNVVSARKGMGKSAMISRMAYKLEENGDALVIRVTGNSLLGLGDFQDQDQAYLENYWKQIICKKIILEIGKSIGFALTSDEISMVEISELEGMKSKNIIGGLVSRIKGKIPLVNAELKQSFPENLQNLLQNYQVTHQDSSVWILIDDIDAKYKDTEEYQARVGSFFSAVRSLSFDMNNLNIRASVRSDVWANLRHLEDLDKWEQYVIEIFWTKKQLREMLANRILAYIQRKHPQSKESQLKIGRDYNQIFGLVFNTPIRWRDDDNASIFDAVYSFSNKRPRWMGQLCRMAAVQTKKNSPHNKKIDLDYINQILDKYGQNRKNDLIKEHQHQFSELDKLIDSFRANNKTYSCSSLSEMFDKNFIRGRPLNSISEIDGKKYASLNDLGEFSYKIGLISKIHENGKNFTHFSDDPDLFRSNENVDDKIVWSVHIAYREFLNIH
ncbi:MAG: P-loop ATPase, Sll1717 family [Pseudomonadaceae bacterium]